MPQIHKLILPGHEVRYFISQWQSEAALSQLFDQFAHDHPGVSPDEFAAWLMTQPNLFFAGGTEIPMLSNVDIFEWPSS